MQPPIEPETHERSRLKQFSFRILALLVVVALVGPGVAFIWLRESSLAPAATNKVVIDNPTDQEYLLVATEDVRNPPTGDFPLPNFGFIAPAHSWLKLPGDRAWAYLALFTTDCSPLGDFVTMAGTSEFLMVDPSGLTDTVPKGITPAPAGSIEIAHAGTSCLPSNAVP